MSGSGRPIDERVGLMATAIGGVREPTEEGPAPLVTEAAVAEEQHAASKATWILVAAAALFAFNLFVLLTMQTFDLIWWGLDALLFAGGAYWWGRSQGSGE